MRELALVALLSITACGGGGGGDGGGPPATGTTPGTWQYVAIPGDVCMNGSATGVGVNLGTSGDLVIYMEGGGACFNTNTCQSVAHQDGWGPDQFATNIGEYNIGLFDRTDPDNPLRDASFVFVPYCTGDVHSGSNPAGMGGRAFVGYQNVGRDLDYLVPLSANVKRVVLAGSSAGGFGALINYDRTQAAFGATPVHLIDDSGPPLPDPYMTPCLQQQFRTAWNLDAAIPAGCTTCSNPDGGGLSNALGWLADAHPGRRLALISSTHDGVVSAFFGFGYPDCATGGSPIPADAYAAAIAELRDQTLAGHANFRMYTKDSSRHVWLLDEPSTISPRMDGSGEHLSQWLTDMLDGAAWDSVSP